MTERRSGKLSLLGLPTETLTAIFLRLGYIDLYTLRNTCLLFRTIIEQSNFDRVMLRQQYDPSLIEDIVNQHIRRSALYPVPGTVGAQSNRTPPSAFDVKLHPVLQSFGWAMCVEDYTIVYNWPLRNDMETIWEKENATTPPLRELHLRAGIYRFHLHTEDDRHCIQVHHVLDCLRKAVIETAGEDFELVRTLGCRGAKDNDVWWFLRAVEDDITGETRIEYHLVFTEAYDENDPFSSIQPTAGVPQRHNPINVLIPAASYQRHTSQRSMFS